MNTTYVYWDKKHTFAVMGSNNAQEMMTLEASEFQILGEERKFVVRVQEGSMVPQDELSVFNNALQEWENGVSDPLTYYERTKDSNPLERAQRLMQFKMNPAQYSMQYLQIQPPAPVMPQQGMEQGGGGSTSGEPGVAVGAPQQGMTPPNPIQQKESQILGQVPIT